MKLKKKRNKFANRILLKKIISTKDIILINTSVNKKLEQTILVCRISPKKWDNLQSVVIAYRTNQYGTNLTKLLIKIIFNYFNKI